MNQDTPSAEPASTIAAETAAENPSAPITEPSTTSDSVVSPSPEAESAGSKNSEEQEAAMDPNSSETPATPEATPVTPAGPTPEQIQEANATILADCAWRARAAYPGSDSADLYFFDNGNPELSQAEWIGWQMSFAGAIQTFLKHFLPMAKYVGLRNTYARIKEELMDVGVDPDQAWTRAYLSWHLIESGLSVFNARLTSVLMQSDKNDELPLVYPLSPLHLWAINEATRAFLLDLHPAMTRIGSAPCGGNLTMLAAQAKQLNESIAAEIPYLEGEGSPYLYIVTESGQANDAIAP